MFGRVGRGWCAPPPPGGSAQAPRRPRAPTSSPHLLLPPLCASCRRRGGDRWPAPQCHPWPARRPARRAAPASRPAAQPRTWHRATMKARKTRTRAAIARMLADRPGVWGLHLGSVVLARGRAGRGGPCVGSPHSGWRAPATRHLSLPPSPSSPGKAGALQASRAGGRGPSRGRRGGGRSGPSKTVKCVASGRAGREKGGPKRGGHGLVVVALWRLAPRPAGRGPAARARARRARAPTVPNRRAGAA